MAVVAHFWRYQVKSQEEFDTVDEAFRFLAYGEEWGHLSSEKIVDGDTVYDGLEFDARLDAAMQALV